MSHDPHYEIFYTRMHHNINSVVLEYLPNNNPACAEEGIVDTVDTYNCSVGINVLNFN